MRAIGFLFFVSMLLVSACEQQRATSPRRTIDSYASLMKAKNWPAAYRMLSSDSRAELSLAQFIHLVEDNPEEVEFLVNSLCTEVRPPMVKARFTTKAGEVLELTYEDGAWRIDESAIQIYSQTTPRAALRAFVRAFDNKRFDVLLRFVPDAQKENLNAELLRASWLGEQQLSMELVVEGLRPQLDRGKIELLGDHAAMSYGTGGSVELVREHGAWKIQDFQ